MNIGFLECGIFCFVFLLSAFIFTVFKEKATILIGGFNMFSKEKKEQYDRERMSRDQRNAFLLWATIFGVGAALSYFVSPYMAIAAFIVWLFVFVKDIHLDDEKAFGKYRKR